MEGLPEQKVGWLGYDDKKAGKRLGCLPLYVGMPVYLNDHINRPKGLVAGLPGIVRRIWFDGDVPSQPNESGEYVCKKLPTAIVIDFVGFAEPVTIRPTGQDWKFGVPGTATLVRRRQFPVVPDFGCTAPNGASYG